MITDSIAWKLIHVGNQVSLDLTLGNQFSLHFTAVHQVSVS